MSGNEVCQTKQNDGTSVTLGRFLNWGLRCLFPSWMRCEAPEEEYQKNKWEGDNSGISDSWGNRASANNRDES